MRPEKHPGVALPTMLAALALVLTSCSAGGVDGNGAGAKAYVTQTLTDGVTSFVRVENPDGGPALSFASGGPASIIEQDIDGQKMAFKDVNGDGVLKPYEDWRLDAEERARSLATELTREQLAGLMVMTAGERAPADGLTNAQKKYLEQSNVRAILNAGPNNVTDAVIWSNQIQAFAESMQDRPYLPVQFASDPRFDAIGNYIEVATGDVSAWPGNLGLAALHDPARVEEFAEVTSEELRAMGINIALAPQVDLATEPRWTRVAGTFGDDTQLIARIASAYVDGYQNSFDADGAPRGWGETSVMTVMKHFAGDSATEGGRDTHIDEGKYTVFPGDNWDEHLVPFQAATQTGGVMSAYSIALDGTGEALFERVGTAYDERRLAILRDELGFEGIIFSDWDVIKSPSDPDNASRWGEAWGVEDLSVPERFLAGMKAGIDVFGGERDTAPLLQAADLWDQAYAAGTVDIDAKTRMRQSATRVLTNAFRTGIYDNPYLDLDHSLTVAGDAEKVTAGYAAQTDSVVVLKNADGAIPCDPGTDWSTKTAYIPSSFDLGWAAADYPDDRPPVKIYPTLEIEAAEKIFKTVLQDEVVLNADGSVAQIIPPDLSDADIALVGMNSPNNGNSASGAGHDRRTDEWYPLSLQYRPYTADSEAVRTLSISGDNEEDGSRQNRSYFEATSRISNEADLDALLRASAAAADSGRPIPVLALVRSRNPVIPAEFEPLSSAIIVGFGVSDQALIDVATGRAEALGRLPLAFPADMETVEASRADLPRDYAPYGDSQGHLYDGGFGLKCNGETLN